MLDAFDQLDLVAEISATLLGFIAVFLALSKGDGRFSASDRHFIQALVLSSVLAIVLALAPRSISLFIVGDAIWDISLIVGIVLGSLTMFLMAWHHLHMPREEAAKVHWLWHAGAWAFGMSAAVLFLLAALRLSNISALYVGGVTLLVPLALWCFISVF